MLQWIALQVCHCSVKTIQLCSVNLARTQQVYIAKMFIGHNVVVTVRMVTYGLLLIHIQMYTLLVIRKQLLEHCQLAVGLLLLYLHTKVGLDILGVKSMPLVNFDKRTVG